ncbi:MAG: NAD(P)/FAD-dependent oxidoreductase [Candidatus Eremiobacteraeota bacterium]|nr:NAD(P)/FAD-dependent oxidoreductase [Candidatus Eremiobacteraeota bacterium]
MKTHSTGALSADQHRQQDALYATNPTYDVVVVGTGMAGLTAAALLANSGRKVCMLEAHDIPGGYVHSFRMGDYHFCAQIHYIWGAGRGDRVWRFLEKLGLEEDILFEPLDPEGYDHIILPDRKRVKIPNGYEQLAKNIEAAYPGQGEGVRRFTHILDQLSDQVRQLPAEIRWWQYLTRGWRFLTLLRYHRKTLQQVFDECGVGREAQAVLIANSGNFMCPPRDLSILAYNGLFSGYNRGAYYPRRHFRYFIDRLVEFITSHDGCHVYYEQEVTEVKTEGQRVESVTTRDGKTFTAPLILCNADPQKMSHLIGRDKFAPSALPALSYDYSWTAVTVYLGLKDIDLRDYGFGRHNTWHLEQWDLNQTWDEAMRSDWSKPWMFMATPSLHTPEEGTTPPGGQILELATGADYDHFRRLRESDPKAYRAEKKKVEQKLIDLVEAHHVPDLRQHIALHVAGSPTTNEDYCYAPRGHAYGQHLTPENMGLGRLRAQTPWKNFFWCNAASGYPGVNGTIGTGMQLYMDLTGDRFWDPSQDL